MAEEDKWQRQAEEAIRNYLVSVGDDFPTGRFVIIAEAITPEAERVVYMASAIDQSAWDTMGLIEYAKTVEISQAVRTCLEE